MKRPAASGVAPEVTRSQLFRGFSRIGLSGFGGVMAWCRRVLVEERRWLNDRDFDSLFALCQFLPGPSITNLSVCVGARFRGWSGALAALVGLYAGPTAIMITLGSLYDRYAALTAVRGALSGIAAVAAGLILAMGLKMAGRFRSSPFELSLVGLVLAGAMGGWSLAEVLGALVPTSLLVASRRGREGQ